MESGRNNVECPPLPDANGTNNGSVALYKPLLKDDSAAQSDKDTMVKKDHEMELDDGAKEKMIADEASINPDKSPTEVLYIAENGDAKIDIENVKNTLSGMGKEELMKYANDPFWVRLRWILFIGFWIIWFAMLAGAVAIIAMAPKCPTPRPWWEKSPLIQIEPRDIADKNLAAVESMLDHLRSSSIQAISLVSFLKGSPGGIIDFEDVNSAVGGREHLEKIIAAAKKRDIRVVLEFDPNHSSQNHSWFQRSVQNEKPYTDYYIWRKPEAGNSSRPNNWLSVSGGSAWTLDPTRRQWYLHQVAPNCPDFNFTNSAVIEEFKKIFKIWIDRGISGFRLGSVEYLTEDPAFNNEDLRTSVGDDYNSLVHSRTRDQPKNEAILRIWHDHVKNLTNKDALFGLSNSSADDILNIYNQDQQEMLVELPQSSHFTLIDSNLSSNANAMKSAIDRWISNKYVGWSGWNFNVDRRLPRYNVSRDVVESIALMSMLLPGTPIFKISDIGGKAFETQFSKLMQRRTSISFQHGNFNSTVFNDTVFVYTRARNDSTGFLVAYQAADATTTIDVSNLPHVSAEVKVHSASPNWNNGNDLPETLEAKNIEMKPKSTLVVSYDVPR